MDVKSIVLTIVAAVGCVAALASVLFFTRLRWPSPILWFTKLYVAALSPLFAGLGVIITIVGIATASALVTLIGVYDAVVFFVYVHRVTRPPKPSTGFERAFGLHWESSIRPEHKNHFLPLRTILKLPAVPEPRVERNLPFATIPDTSRQLLCDVWQPGKDVIRSGLAFIYLHGSAFYFLDKDNGTRPFFRHLAAQGHVIMDVAYRLFPETDVMGMVHDVKRAITWMKDHGSAYLVDPQRIVVGGGSSGGHLALLAAYTANDREFSPKELVKKNTGVCAVVSLYGSNDMAALYYHTNQHLTTRSAPGRPRKKVPTKMPAWIVKSMGEEYHRLGLDKGFENAGAIAPLMGGHPDECPETYARFSVITHVHPGCPPTYLVHGGHDVMAPVKSTRRLYTRLVEEKVPAVLNILPQTDHAFDLILPAISPSAHTAVYDVERFLALQSRTYETSAIPMEAKQESRMIH